MIILVAPYSPVSLSSHPHLGAARKLEAVIKVLSALDEVVLVNSAHNDLDKEGFNSEITIGEVSVHQITPKRYKRSSYGKLMNIFEVRDLVKKCFSIGEPKFIWIYNSYIFESLFAREVLRNSSCPVILEFEDWFFARKRLSLKPVLDYLSWMLIVKKINFSFVVNDQLGQRLKPFGVPSSPFPGIISSDLMDVSDARKPFSSQIVYVGYFGGLSEEKGADFILRMAKSTSHCVRFLVSGAGPLEMDFLKASKEMENIDFFGCVNDEKLNDIISSCDVILNPHSPIVNMGEGVFPFKVVEAISTGRLVISTPLPLSGSKELLGGVVFVNNEVELLSAINSSRELYFERLLSIQKSASYARQEYSFSMMKNKIENVIESID